MPRLPDVTALGGRPAPTPEMAAPTFRTGVVERAQAQNAAQMATVGKDVAELGARMAEAQQVARTRQDVVARAGAKSAYDEFAQNEFLRLTTEADIADEATVTGFGKALADQMQKTLDTHTGSEDSKARLAVELMQTRSSLAQRMGLASFEAGQKRVLSVIGNDINGFVSGAAERPEELSNLFRGFEARVADVAPALSPESEMNLRTTGRRQMMMAAIGGFLDRGDDQAARAIMAENPAALSVLTAEDQAKLREKFTSIERERNAGRIKANSERQYLRTFLGREPTTAELVKHAGLTLEERNAQTEAGKRIQDRLMFVRQFGENSPQVRAFDADTKSGAEDQTQTGNVRREFFNLSREFIATKDAFSRVANADDTLAGDKAIVYGFVKMLDPGSSVMEGEFATAENTPSVPDKVRQMYNQTVQGRSLLPEQRKGFKDQAKSLFEVAIRNHAENEVQYRSLAQRNGMNPDNVVLDYVGAYRSAVTGIDKPGNAMPQVGEVRGNRKFKGGDPTKPENWPLVTKGDEQ